MSTTIDNRVVEMRFDNAHFERNVQTSLSTLEKLKQKLNLTGASKGLNDVNAAAKNNSMPVLGKAVESVGVKFSALQVAGITCLTNLTNSAYRAGERMIKALTIDPIKTGFQEYETQMNAVQTILANTQSKGSTLNDVNKALDTLNTYADKTIYNFTEMTRNIGTFTAAGVDLQTSVDSIQGIANLAAVSGSSSQQASTAMYQLSQALAAGRVSLMDWNSVVNAGMGGELFQNALIRTSELLKTGAKDAIATYGSFRESLTRGEWLTTEVLTETLKQLSGAYSEAELIAQGFTEEQAKEISQLAKTATDAATKVKTFTQLWDVLKESAQSGWSQTWKLLIGDFEQAKSLLTPLADVLTGFIGKMSDARNDLLKSALGKGFTDLGKKIRGALKPVEKVADTVTNVKKSVSDLGTVVDDVILGKFGNGEDRFNALTKAGKNYYEIQNKVNEKLGNSKRYTQEQIDTQNKLIKTQGETTDATKDTAKATDKLTDEQKKQLKSLVKLSDEQLRSKGYTEDQIKALNELKQTAKKLGLPIEELIDNLDELNGRWLLINSFKNIGEAIIKVFKSMGDAWRSTFKAITSDQLFDAITGFHRFTESLVMSDDTAKKLTSTFKGLFALLDIVTTIAGGGIKLAFTVISGVLDALGTDILTVTANIGEAISKFNNFLKNNKVVTGIYEAIASGIRKATDAINGFIESIKNNETIQSIVKTFEDLWKKIFGGDETTEGSNKLDSEIDKLSTYEKAAQNFSSIVEGILKGLDISWSLASASFMGGIKILNELLKLFGTDFAGLLSNIADGVSKLAEWIDFKTIFGANTKWADIAAIIKTVYDNVIKCIRAFGELGVVQKIINNIRDCIKELFGSVDGMMNSLSLENVTESINDFFGKIESWIGSLKNSENLGRDIVAGIANGIRSGIGDAISAIQSIASALIDSFCALLGINSPSTVFKALGAFVIIGLILGLSEGKSEIKDAIVALATLITDTFSSLIQNGLPKLLETVKSLGSKLVDSLKGVEIDFNKLFVAGVIITLLVFAKKLIDVADKIANPLDALGGLFGSLKSGIEGLFGAMKKNIQAKALKTAAEAILDLAKALALMSGTLVALGYVPWQKLVQGGIAMTVVAGGLAALLFAASKMSLEGFSFAKLAVMIISLSVGLLIMASALKKISSIDDERIDDTLKTFGTIIAGLIGVIVAYGKLVTFLQAANIDKAGIMLLKIASGIALLAVAMKIIATMSTSDITKGLFVVAALEAFMIPLITVSYFAGEHADKAGKMLFKMAFAIGILALVMKLIGTMDGGDIFKGLFVIGALEMFFAALVAVSYLAGEHANQAGKMLLKMSIAIGILALAIKAIASLSSYEIEKGIELIETIAKLFAAFIILANFSGPNTDKAGSMIFKLSAGVLVLAAAIKLIGTISGSDIAKGIGVIAAMEILFGALIAVSMFAGPYADKAGSMLLKMSAAILILVGVIALMSFLDPADIAIGTAAISAMMGMFALLIASTSKLKVEKVMGPLIVMIAAVGILAAAIGILARIDDDGNVAMAAASLSGVMAVFALLIKTTSGMKLSDAKGILALTAMAVPLAAFAFVLSGIDDVSDKKGTIIALTAAMTAMTILLAAVSAISKFINGGTIEGIVALSGMILPLALFAITLDEISDVSVSVGTIEALTKVMAAMTLLMIPLSLIGKFLAGGLIGGIAGLTAMIIPLAAFALTLELFPVSPDAITTVEILTKLMTAMTLLLIPLGIIGYLAPGLVGGIVALTAMVIPLRTFAKELSVMPDLSGSSSNIEVLTTLMTSMTKLLAPLSLIGFLAIGALAGVVALTAMVIPLKVFANALLGIPDLTPAVPTMNIISSFMDTMTDILMKVTPLAPLAVIGVAAIGALGGVITAFGVFATGVGYLMEKNESLQSFLNTGIAVLQGIAEGLGRVIGSFITGFSEEIMTILPSLGTALSDFWNNASTFINGIQSLDEGIIGKVGILAGVIIALTAADLIYGITNFLGISSGFGDMATQLSNFMTKLGPFIEGCENLKPSMATSVKNLANAILALTAGDLIQTIASKFGGGVSFEDFGTQLVAFGKAVCEFSNTIEANGGINEEAVTAAKNAGMLMTELQSSIEPMGGVLQAFTGKKNLEDFGAQLKAYGSAVCDFSNTITENGGVNEEAVEAAANAGKLMAELQSSIEPVGGVLEWLAGDTGLDTFGEQLKAYGESVSAFSKSISGDNAITEDAVESVKNAGLAMIELQKAIPEDKIFDGKVSLEEFGGQIKAFGESMKPIAELDAESLTISIDQAKRLVKFAEGLVDFDDSGIANFESVKDIGTAIGGYFDKVQEIDTAVLSTSISAASKLKTLATGLVDFDNSGITKFSSVSSIGTAIGNFFKKVQEIDPGLLSSSISIATRLRSFAMSLVEFDNSGITKFSSVSSIGTAMRNYYNKVEGFDSGPVNLSISAANRLKTFINGLAEIDNSGIAKFKPGPIGASLKDYAASVAGADFGSIGSSISAANRIKNFISSLAGLDTSGVGSFKTAINSLSEINFASLQTAFSNASSSMVSIGSKIVDSLAKGVKSKQATLVSTAKAIITAMENAIKSRTSAFRSAGVSLMSALASGISSQRGRVTTAVSSTLSSAASSMRGYYGSFYSAGSYLVSGFVSGISSNITRAATAAASMANAAEAAAKNALNINSPSKIFMALGSGVVEGFVKGIHDNERDSSSAAESMANTAISGFSGAISRITDLLDSDMDMQPTIRPVVDLSDVTSGARAVNGLFSMTPSVGVMSNVRSINAMVNRRNQNGVNEDIISAIKDLKNSIGESTGNTYNVNGITYDDGSNVSNAIQSIVRAARIERRV